MRGGPVGLGPPLRSSLLRFVVHMMVLERVLSAQWESDKRYMALDEDPWLDQSHHHVDLLICNEKHISRAFVESHRHLSARQGPEGPFTQKCEGARSLQPAHHSTTWAPDP